MSPSTTLVLSQYNQSLRHVGIGSEWLQLISYQILASNLTTRLCYDPKSL